jgi:5-methyltetrahydropteroyltriglutamate--homocysteine methyltransferase
VSPQYFLDDGKQSPESFVVYLRHRQTGLGGTSVRPIHPCLDKYPAYKAESQQHTAGKDIVSKRAILPKASGTIPLADPTASESECRDFRVAAPDETGGGCIEPFLTAPSPDAGRA